MRIFEIIYSTILNRCPRCHEGVVFKDENPNNLKRMFEMNKSCDCCDLKYEKVPGFFYGALYVSYALTSGWFIVLTLLQLYWLNWETLAFVFFVVGTLIVLSPLSLRWSRLIWMNFFVKYNNENQKIKNNRLSYDKYN